MEPKNTDDPTKPNSKQRSRYHRLVMERFYAMLAGNRFSELRKKWLARLNRDGPFQSMDDWVAAEGKLRQDSSDLWWDLQSDVAGISESYGLAPWQVSWALMIEGYDPLKSDVAMFALDGWNLQAKLRVWGLSEDVLEKLITEGQRHGIYVEICPPPDPEKYSIENYGQIWLSIEIPVECPPDLVVKNARSTLMISRQMLRDAGIHIPLRVRSASSDTTVAVVFSTHVARTSSPFIEALIGTESETGVPVVVEAGQPSIASPDDESKGPLGIVRLRVEFPVHINARDLDKKLRAAMRNSRRALKQAGLEIGDRLRVSSLAEQSADLRVDGEQLEVRELGDLVDEVFGVFPAMDGKTTKEGAELKGRLKSRRNQIKDRMNRKGLLPPE